MLTFCAFSVMLSGIFLISKSAQSVRAAANGILEEQERLDTSDDIALYMALQHVTTIVVRGNAAVINILESNTNELALMPDARTIKDSLTIEGTKLMIDVKKTLPDQMLYLYLPTQFRSFSVTVENFNATINVQAKNLDTLDLNSFSGSIVMHEASARMVKATSMRGDILINNCVIGVLRASTTAGNITVTSEVTELYCDASENGSIRYSSSKLFNYASLKGASGPIRLDVPGDRGFQLNFKTKDGALANYMDGLEELTPGLYQYGDGLYQLAVETINGKVQIHGIPIPSETDENEGTTQAP
jgi:DUF4097 and DUF4098 domain-containing protein YvlB